MLVILSLFMSTQKKCAKVMDLFYNKKENGEKSLL